MTGDIMRQGPHHGAHRSISTGTGLLATSSVKLSRVISIGFIVIDPPVMIQFFSGGASLAVQISCVAIPIGQYTHHDRGRNRAIVMRPSTVEVSMTL